MRFLAVLGLALALSGCSPDFYKPGATAHDLDADRTACNVEARQDAPPAMTAAPFGAGGPNSLANANCYGPGFGAVTCNPIGPAGSSYLPPPPIPIDTNGGKRNALFESCMAEHGWSHQQPDQAAPQK